MTVCGIHVKKKRHNEWYHLKLRHCSQKILCQSTANKTKTCGKNYILPLLERSKESDQANVE